MWYMLLFLVIGIILGFACSKIHKSEKIAGSIVIDYTNEDGPYLFLELEIPMNQLSESKNVTLSIKNNTQN